MIKSLILIFLLGMVLVITERNEAQASAVSSFLPERRTLFAQGMDYFRAQDYEQSLSCFQLLHGRYPELEEYVLYFLSKNYQALQDLPKALEGFQQFSARYSNHPLSDDVQFSFATVLLALHRPEEALREYDALLAKGVSERGELLYHIGLAYLAVGRKQEAVTALDELIRSVPRHERAEEAQDLLRRILTDNPQLKPVWTEEQLFQYAEALFNARCYAQSIRQHQAFQELYPNSPRRGESRFRIAEASFSSGNRPQGMKILQDISRSFAASNPDLAAGALYARAMKQWGADCNETAKQDLQKIIGDLPENSWRDDAYYLLGRISQAENALAAAAQSYISLYSLYPESPLAEESAWRAGWSCYLARDYESALRYFSLTMTTFSGGEYHGPSLYWTARSLEQQRSREAAVAAYCDLVATFPESYYGIRGQARLEELKVEVRRKPLPAREHPDLDVLLAQVAGSTSIPSTCTLAARTATALELQAVRLPEYALKEARWCEAACTGEKRQDDKPQQQAVTMYIIARLYGRLGDHLKAIRLVPVLENLVRSAGSEMFSYDLHRLSYPLEYWDLIKKYARRHDLDPFLVAGLIRQESCFNPRAVSHAGAGGLMQIMDATGKITARKIGIGDYTRARLFDPETNIRIGTAYFASLRQQFGGDLFRTVAAYNAGPAATGKWWPACETAVQEAIVENITYGETRRYVKLVLRNQYMYQSIYEDLE